VAKSRLKKLPLRLLPLLLLSLRRPLLTLRKMPLLRLRRKTSLPIQLPLLRKKMSLPRIKQICSKQKSRRKPAFLFTAIALQFAPVQSLLLRCHCNPFRTAIQRAAQCSYRQLGPVVLSTQVRSHNVL